MDSSTWFPVSVINIISLIFTCELSHGSGLVESMSFEITPEVELNSRAYLGNVLQGCLLIGKNIIFFIFAVETKRYLKSPTTLKSFLSQAVPSHQAHTSRCGTNCIFYIAADRNSSCQLCSSCIIFSAQDFIKLRLYMRSHNTVF